MPHVLPFAFLALCATPEVGSVSAPGVRSHLVWPGLSAACPGTVAPLFRGTLRLAPATRIGFHPWDADLDTPEPDHAANPLYGDLLANGMDLGGHVIRFPAPRLRDGQSAEEQRKALAQLAGSERGVDDFLRDSVTAPFVLKVRDEATKAGDPIRLADLAFAVHADLDAINPADTARRSAGKPTEVANMRLETTLLTAEALKPLDIPAPKPEREWYAHLSARLLDRIGLEATDHVVVSRSADSWVIASRTDPRFGTNGAAANAWTPLKKDGSPAGEAKPYVGGAGITKISRLTGSPGTLVVEAHFAFVEPRPWFDGAPILRSKFAPVAQDQIRRLRREVKARAR